MSVDTLHRAYRSILRDNLARTRRPYLPANVDYVLRGRVFPVLRALRAEYRDHPAENGSLQRMTRSAWLAATLTRDPAAYGKLGLSTAWHRRADFIYHDHIIAILPYLNKRVAPEDSHALQDKRRFARRCASAGLPAAQPICEFENGQIVSDLKTANWKQDLFSKFTDLYNGIGATLWRYQDGAHRNGTDVFTVEGLKDHLRKLSLSRPVLLQARLRNHEDLIPIAGNALSTARIVTVQPAEGEPAVALGVYRMAIGDAVADNFTAGGVAAPIDLDTGKLGAAVTKAGRTGVTYHPNSGAPIEGTQLPFWTEAKELAMRAHREFAQMPSVGWDVAITQAGPILIEGNAVWCVDIAQMAHQRPLADTIVPAALASHLKHLG